MTEKKQRRHLWLIILILFLGLGALFFTKTHIGFNLLYKVFSSQINRRGNFNISIKELSAGMKTQLRAGRLEFSNADSSIIFSVDTMNVKYGGIFELLGKRYLDKLSLTEPQLYLRIEDSKKDSLEISELKLPRFSIGQLNIKNMQIRIDTPDTLYIQNIEKAYFSYKSRRDEAQILIRDLKAALPMGLGPVENLSGELTFKNDIAKLRNLDFTLQEAKVRSSGKIYYRKPLRFQFHFNVNNILLSSYPIPEFFDENDKINLKLELLGSFHDFSALLDISGVLNKKKIHYANISLEYKDDYIHLLGASFKNPGNDLSLHGSYSLKDHYISSSFSFHVLELSDWDKSLPDFGLRGRIRASGYQKDWLKLNYDLEAQQIYGLPFVHLNGSARIDSMETFQLDSENILSLPAGNLKVRGNIEDLKTLNLDIYGNIDHLSGLEIPDIQAFEAKELTLTLKLLGNLENPDIQFNVNLDTLRYDNISLFNTNISLSGNHILKDANATFLLSLDEALFDTLSLGAIEAFVHVDSHEINLDYLDFRADNYKISMSASIPSPGKYNINSLQGTYMDQSIRLLDPLTFTKNDSGFSLSPFNLLYHDALLYGSLDLCNDSIWGSINIVGAELETFPMSSHLRENIKGLLDVSINIDGFVEDPRIGMKSTLRKAKFYDLHTERIRMQMNYADKNLHIQNLFMDFEKQNSLQILGSIPLGINFREDPPYRIFENDSIKADIKLKNIDISGLSSRIEAKLDLQGKADLLASVRGTPKDPLIEGDLSLLAPGLSKIRADTLYCKVSYRDKRFYFDHMRLRSKKGFYEGRISFYTDLSYMSDGPLFSADSSLYVFIQGQDEELPYLTPFLRDVESLSGDFFTKLEIRGSFLNNLKDGLVRVRDGNLVLGVLANDIKNIEGDFRLEDNIADVDIRGKVSKVSYTIADILGLQDPLEQSKENLWVNGKMDMSNLIRPKFNLRILGDRMSILTLDDNFNLTMGNVDIAVQGKDTLLVSGDLTIQEGLVELGFKRPISRFKDPEEGKIALEYALNAEVDKMYIRNQFLDAQLYGEIDLLKYIDDERARLGGQLDVHQGIFTYWPSVFELEEGSIAFDPFLGEHELNFTAFKAIGRDNRITATITGPLNNPEIDFVDDNNQLSKAEIIRELTIGQIEGTFSGGGSTAQRTTTALMALAERPLEQQVQKLGIMGGLERIDIKGGELAYIDSSTAVVVGGRIGRNFYLTYEGSRSEPMNIEIEYRINNQLSIIGSADEESVSGAFRLRLQY